MSTDDTGMPSGPLNDAAAAGAVRVVLADDQALVRMGLRALLEAEPDLEVIGEAADGAEAIALARELRPDIVCMDIRMPGTDGLTATERILSDADLEGTRVIVLTTFELDEYVFRALRAGASGFLGKGGDPTDLVRAIRTVMAGDRLLSPKATSALVAHFTGQPDAVSSNAESITLLTEREKEVVQLVATGLSNDEIAARLVISPLTAKTHVHRCLTKLGLRDRAQLVVAAYQSGLVRP